MISKILDRNRFILVLVTWLLVNSIRFVSSSSFSQLFSILLAGWALLILLKEYLESPEKIFKIPGLGFGALFVLAVILSFIGNGMVAPVKNVYTVIAVTINFFMIYTTPFLTENKTLVRVLKIIAYATLFLNLINLVLLFFRYTYIMGDPSNLRQVNFIGFDYLRGRFTGLSGNANGLSRLALNGLLATVPLLLTSTSKKGEKVIFSISMFINVLVILLSQSRASIYAISLALGISVSVFLFLKLQDSKKSNVLVVIVLLVFSVIVSLGSLKVIDKASYLAVDNFPKSKSPWPGGSSNIGNDSSNGEDNDDFGGRDDEATNSDFSNGRFTLMENGIKATLEYNPIFGLSYATAQERVQKYIVEKDIVVHSWLFNMAGQMHNTIVQSFVYYGFLGLITLLIFALFIIMSYFKYLSRRKTSRSSNANTFVLLTFALVVLLTMNMVEWVFIFDFDNHLINTIFFLVLGYMVNFVYSECEDCKENAVDSKIRKILGSERK